MQNIEGARAYLAHRQAERAVNASKRTHESMEGLESMGAMDEILSKVEAELSHDSDVDVSGSGRIEALYQGAAQVQEDASLEEQDIQDLGEKAQKRLNDFLYGVYMKFLDPIGGVKARLEQSIQRSITQVNENHHLREQTMVWRKIQEAETTLANIDELVRRRSLESPEAFIAFHLLLLRKYKRQFKRYGIIKTPEIERRHVSIMHSARKHLEGENGVVTLLGPTGAGKTVMALEIAETLSPEGDYEYIQAHSKMVPEDMLVRYGISISEIEAQDVPDRIADALKKYDASHADSSQIERDNAHESIRQAITAMAGQRPLVTKEIIMAVERAKREGKKVVIDEFNYLQPETLAALNRELNDRNDAKDGFGVILTGNIGKEYSRKDLDPAFVNRVLTGVIDYGYPPQEDEKSLEESIIESDDYLNGEHPADRDLYIAGVTQLLDVKGNLIAPRGTLENVWDLSRAFSKLQRLSRGEDARQVIVNTPGFQQVSVAVFKKIFLSFRNFNSIVRSWKRDGFSKPLDDYFYEKLIKPAMALAPNEAAQLIFFSRFCGLLESERYSHIVVNPSTWKISFVDKILPSIAEPNAGPQNLVYISSQEVVEKTFGIKTPDYKIDEGGEEAKENQEDQQQLKEKMQWDKERKIATEKLEKYNKFGDLCLEDETLLDRARKQIEKITESEAQESQT